MTMNLTEQQQDALTELVNIAFGKTAASLSELTGQRVLIEGPPQVDLKPVEDLTSSLGALMGEEPIASVHQIFSGSVKGDAFLALDHNSALQLVDLLVEQYYPPPRLDASAREVLTEVGNDCTPAQRHIFSGGTTTHSWVMMP